MKVILYFFVFAILTPSIFAQQPTALFPAPKNNLWGYINKDGKMRIEPTFQVAMPFSEGLAAVRENGSYGFIDTAGNLVIPPIYDFVQSFRNGAAVVYKDGSPQVINLKGTSPTHIPNPFHPPYTKTVIDAGRKVSLVNCTAADLPKTFHNKIPISDQCHYQIHEFQEEVAIINGLKFSDEGRYVRDENKTGVIDTAGNWVVPFEVYANIDDFQRSYAEVVLLQPLKKSSGLPHNRGIINKRGELKFTFSSEEIDYDHFDGGFFEGIAIVDYYDTSSYQNNSQKDRKYYKAILDTNGKLLFKAMGSGKILPFSSNRSFVDSQDHFILVNRQGKQVGGKVFDEVVYKHYNDKPQGAFYKGKAIVYIEDRLFVVDTNGILQQNQGLSVLDLEELNGNMTRLGNYLIFEKTVVTNKTKGSERDKNVWGFWNIETGVYVKPTYEYIDKENLDEALIFVVRGGMYGYINPQGKELWMETIGETKNRPFNVDYMNRGYFYAYSAASKGDFDYGGWATSENTSQKITSTLTEELQLTIYDSVKTTWRDQYKGQKVTLQNGSLDTFYFAAQDSRLYLKIQALDKSGEWRDIEYLPSSWCGNSYHELALSPKSGWSFTMPVYEGVFKTKVRAQLSYKDKITKKEELLYSNEVSAGINPGQFWNKRVYNRAAGLMDPYSD